MGSRKVKTLLPVVVVLIVFWAINNIGAGPQAASSAGQDEASVTGVTSVLLQYQGRLSDPSTGQTVADGSYTMTFRLYDVASDGSALWTEIKDVAVQGGLFSTALGDTTSLEQALFSGQALWLGIKVGADAEATPRQQVLPVAYALSLVPGAMISGTSSDPILHVVQSGTSVGGYFTSTTASGVEGRTAATTAGRAGVLGVAGLTTYFPSQESGVLGRASDGMGVAGMSDSSIGVYGFSAENHGVYGASDSDGGDYGGYFTGVGGVYGQGVDHGGYFTSAAGYGVRAESSSGKGVYATASATTGWVIGVHGESASEGGDGVYGLATSSTASGYGVNGLTSSESGRGVYGFAESSSGTRVGVQGEVNGSGYGLYTTDNLYVGGACTGCTMVLIARNTSQETLRVGDVVSVSGVEPVLAEHTAPVLQVRQARASDASVLGVVYCRGEFYAASGRERASGDSVQPVEGDVEPGDYLMVVTSGLAQVRVAPALADLTPGQELSAGEVAGRAELAGADANPDLVFARAMEAKPDKDGLLWVLVTVQ